MLPTTIIDPHHHFYDSVSNPALHVTLCKFMGSDVLTYLPEQYSKDVGDTLNIIKTVHVECLPDSGAEEAAWVDACASNGRCNVHAIVASCDPAREDLEQTLAVICASSGRVRGIRWILNYDGALQPGEEAIASRATWPRVNADYLRDEQAASKLERMLALLAKHDLSFDLQCNPAQLKSAAAIFARHPQVRLVLDHLGHPRSLGGDSEDEAKIFEWKEGMLALAELPQVHVKLSMLGYAVPGWHMDTRKAELAKSLVRWVISTFGANRCMFATNWPVDGFGDGGHSSSNGLDIPTLYAHFAEWVADLPEADRQALFHKTAEAFYRI